MPEQHISAELRQRVIERARGCCEYCRTQAKYATQSLSVEHILARTKGGTTALVTGLVLLDRTVMLIRSRLPPQAA